MNILNAIWDFEKNHPLKPEDFSLGSHKIVHFKCAKTGHEWKGEIRGRARSNGQCVCCYSKKVASKAYNLAIINPKKTQNWNYQKNKIQPNQVTPQSHQKVFWKCTLCGYEEFIAPKHKTTDCKKCQGFFEKELKLNQLDLDQPKTQFFELLANSFTPNKYNNMLAMSACIKGYFNQKKLAFLCLPFIGQEIYLYQKQGIQLKNIVGLERNRTVFNTVQPIYDKYFPEVNLIYGNIDKWLLNSTQDFDLIHLDYTGPLILVHLEAMVRVFLICTKPLLFITVNQNPRNDGMPNNEIYFPILDQIAQRIFFSKYKGRNKNPNLCVYGFIKKNI